MAGTQRVETFNVSAEKLYDVIIKYADYPEFVDGVNEINVLEQTETSARVEYTLKIIKKFRYTVKLVQERPRRVSWTLESGDIFKSNSGEWILESLGPNQTKVTYKVDIDLKVFAPKAILDGLVTTNLPSMMKAFAERAES
jgi:coenzyme Q-binding protein COQ10